MANETIKATLAELSEEAKSALLAAPSSRQGEKAPVSQAQNNGWVWWELFDANLIGGSGGLTMQGTVIRTALMDAAIEAAFS